MGVRRCLIAVFGMALFVGGCGPEPDEGGGDGAEEAAPTPSAFAYAGFQFTSGGFVRDVFVMNPARPNTVDLRPDVVVALHGSGGSGPRMLDKIRFGDLDTSYVAPSALWWRSGSRHWINLANSVSSAIPDGADETTDLVMLQELLGELAARGAERVALVGFSGGATVTLYVARSGADYTAYGVFSTTLQEVMVDGSGVYAVPQPPRPMMWSMADADPVVAGIPAHLDREQTAAALEQGYGCAAPQQADQGTLCGLPVSARGCGEVPLAEGMVRDDRHTWYSCGPGADSNEGRFQAFAVAAGALH